MSYTNNQLLLLAQTNPKELARALSSPNADTQMLTSGAEILGGEIKDELIVLPVLKKLLKHMHAAVREGAAIGISSFYMEKQPPQDILDMLLLMSNNDPSPNLKEYIKVILQDFEK